MAIKKLGTKLAIAISIGALNCQNAFAWSDPGHQIIAALAWSYMTPAAQAKAQSILAQDTDTLTQPDFVSRSVWADKYREAGRPDGASYIGTREWHFVDIPLSTSGDKAFVETQEEKICPITDLKGGVASVGAPAQDCVVNKINQFAAELADPKTSAAEQVFALKFLIHFVGDIHQPLHTSDNEDHGGNCVWVAPTSHDPMRLHGFWDYQAVNLLTKGAGAADYAKVLHDEITEQQIKDWQIDTPKDWAAASFELSKNAAYNLNTNTPHCDAENKTTPIKLTPEYETTASNISKTQMEKAGVRLAKMLNEVLK